VTGRGIVPCNLSVATRSCHAIKRIISYRSKTERPQRSSCGLAVVTQWAAIRCVYTDTQSLKSKTVPLPPCSLKGKRRYSSYSFLTSTLDVGEWSASRPGRALSREKDPGTLWAGGWVGLRAGLDTEARRKIICLCRGSNPGRLLCSQTLY
jgi:hypothetical protein